MRRLGLGPLAAVVGSRREDGEGFQRVLRFRAPMPVPGTFKFGFASSTGPLTDVHLIRKVALRPVHRPAEGVAPLRQWK